MSASADTTLSGVGTFLSLAADRPTVAGGLKVSAVVGTILNAINQGDLLVTLRLGEVVWWKILLTYCVPFCVSVFSAARIRMLWVPGLSAHRDARLRCRSCDRSEVAVVRGETVPHCEGCGTRTSWRAVG